MIGDVANHLWQSTVFAVAAALLAVAFRRNRAGVRYWLWFSASVKFFVPFALLISLGSELEWAPAAHQMATPIVLSTVVQFSQPFVDAHPSDVAAAPLTPSSTEWIPLAILGVWLCGVGAIALIRLREWRKIRAAADAGKPWSISGAATPPAGVQVRVTPGLMEPGVFGLWHPILLVPAGIEDHLTPRQLEAVIAHELCHVSRRDNLTAAIHMIVEAVFWYHPMVWWIGARLVDERERACDEHVLHIVGEPQAYAEGILNVCKRYVNAPLVCVSGVSGANLRKRVEAIMTNRIGLRLHFAKKIALGVAAVTALVLPVVVGATGGDARSSQVAEPSQPSSISVAGATPVTAQAPVAPQPGQVLAPAFEVASVKRSNPNPTGPLGAATTIVPALGRLTATNVTLRMLVMAAYEKQPFEIVGGLSWQNSEKFDIDAMAEDRTTSRDGILAMLRTLLAERFQVKVHTETREVPLYALVLARDDGRLGAKIKPSTDDCPDPKLRQQQQIEAFARDGAAGVVAMRPKPGEAAPCMVIPEPGTPGVTNLRASGQPMEVLAARLTQFTGRPVVDKTGLKGLYDWEIQIGFQTIRELSTALGVSGPPLPPDLPEARSVTTMLQEDLGLKLESERGVGEVLVIDSAEMPTRD